MALRGELRLRYLTNMNRRQPKATALATLWLKAIFLLRFFDWTLRESFSPFRPLVSELAGKNATSSGKKETVAAALYKPPLPPPFRGFRKKDH
jgi:hypothetical protein